MQLDAMVLQFFFSLAVHFRNKLVTEGLPSKFENFIGARIYISTTDSYAGSILYYSG